MPSPKPRPTRLKVLCGEKNRDRINQHEPVAPIGEPEAPEGLSDAGMSEWRRICAELQQLGILSAVDRSALWGYLAVWERGQEARQVLREEGAYLTSDQGRRYRHPAVAVAEESSRQQRMYLEAFGLTPSSRSRIVASPNKQPKTGIGKFLA